MCVFLDSARQCLATFAEVDRLPSALKDMSKITLAKRGFFYDEYSKDISNVTSTEIDPRLVSIQG